MDTLSDRVAAIRDFSRFYTRRIGVLNESLLDSSLSLTEGRIVYEVAQQPDISAGDLAEDLAVDAGYLSRTLRKLEERGLLVRRPDENDGRRTLIALTEEGRAIFAGMDARSGTEIAALLQPLSENQQMDLVRALGQVTRLLGAGQEAEGAPYVLRTHEPGDMGWIVHRHGVLYAREYGFDETFEALVAEIVARFVQNHDPAGERCWIAEREGEILGSVFLVRESETVAKLRLLYVEPAARGLGVGRRLVAECLRLARRSGYRKIVLWTNDILGAARRIYQENGFRLVSEEKHHSFGQDLVGQYWELDLGTEERQPGS